MNDAFNMSRNVVAQHGGQAPPLNERHVISYSIALKSRFDFADECSVDADCGDSMRALISSERSVRFESRHPVPKCGGDEASIRLVQAAVTRTDVELCKGMFGFRGIAGHQFVGVVESVNGSNTNMVGKRVAGSPIVTCGKCDMCLGGLARHCRHRTILGVIGRDGCLAERFTLPARNLVMVPDSVDDDAAVFAFMVASAMQAAGQLTIVGRPYITVLGDGSLGMLVAQAMAKLNASVRVIGKHAENLSMCEKWGIKHRLLSEIGQRADQDVVVDCTGSAEGLAVAMNLVRARGKVLLKSLFATESAAKNVDLAPVVMKELEVIGSFAGSMADAVAALAKCEFDVISLISKRMMLADGAGIMKAASQPGCFAILVEP